MSRTRPDVVDSTPLSPVGPAAETPAILPSLPFIAKPRHLAWEGKRIPLPGLDHPLRHHVKRALDIVLAALLLVLLLPLLLLITATIRLTSPGPVFFVHERCGCRRRPLGNGVVAWEGRTFGCLKFRTMTHLSDQSLHESHVRAYVRGEIAPGPTVKLVGDPRVTRLGAILRRASLDELPQLVNVLRGEMSLVGPRPVPPYEVRHYPTDAYLARFGALPGITGLWQVGGRSRVGFEQMMALDLDYVRRQSLLLDLKILCRTVPAVLTRQGAA
jgi:lipopolysaccharide/colanic/teichoic acid biosynthesis glycosyltransferase